MDYPTNELLQCIYDCCIQDLPDDWVEAVMEYSENSNEKKAVFQYTSLSMEQLVDYQPSNFIAPMNAAGILSPRYGQHKVIRFKIPRVGNMKITTEG